MPRNEKLSFVLLRIWYKEDLQYAKESVNIAKGWLHRYSNLPETDKKIMKDCLFWAEQAVIELEVGLAMMEGMQDHYDF